MKIQFVVEYDPMNIFHNPELTRNISRTMSNVTSLEIYSENHKTHLKTLYLSKIKHDAFSSQNLWLKTRFILIHSLSIISHISRICSDTAYKEFAILD